MDVSIAEAKNRLAKLVRAVENGETVVITRHGKPVARLASVPSERRQVSFGTMRGRIHVKAGWDDPIDFEPVSSGRVLNGYLLGTNVAMTAVSPERLSKLVRASLT